MKRPLLLILTVIFLAVQGQVAAQQKQAATKQAATKQAVTRTLRGVVTDHNGTLCGATVYLQNKDQRILVGAVTGIQGEYLITIPNYSGNMMIVAGFVGYQTAKLPFTGQKNQNFKLVEDSQSITEVLVIGKAVEKNNMGINRKDLGTATQKIDVTQFENMSVTSIEDMLQGKMANLDIVAASGDPGSAATIRIRGSASLNANNEPLIVIDGIPQDTQVDADFNFGDANVEDFGAMVNMSPNDIQSIEVLKDAAATALWGPKAANGVLLITTKQGGIHKPQFSVSQKLNYSFEPKPLSLLNGREYVTLMQDAMWNWIKDGDYAADRVNTLLSKQDILYDRSYQYFNEFNCDTNWQDLITRNSLNSTTDFSMSGGGEKASYRFSLGYEDQTGTTKGTDYSRITSRLNLIIKFSNKFKVTSNFAYSEGVRNQNFGATTRDLYIQGDSRDNNDIYKNINDELKKPVRNIAIRKMPNLTPWTLDQYGNPTGEYFAQPSSSIQGNLPNPVALANESMNKTLNRTVEATFGTTYSPFKGFNISGSISFQMSTIRNNQFLPTSVIDVKWSNPNYNKGIEALSNKVHTYADVKMTYNKTFNRKHIIALTIAEQIEASNNNSYSIGTSGNGAQEVSTPASHGKIDALASAWSKRRTIGFTGAANYNYKDLYSITFSSRLNANSNTGLKNRWNAPRPSISAVWKMHNEKFMKQLTWIDELRVRGSWGVSEMVPNANFTTGTFAYEVDYMDKTSIKPNQMQLDALKPEVVTQFNVGIDANLWQNKVNITAEYYIKKTTDMLQRNINIQSTTGYANIRYFNAGSVRNKGWEIMVNLNNIVTAGDFKFSLSNLNVSRNVNEILSLPSNMEPDRYTLGNGNYARKLIMGNPIGSIYGYQFDGIYQNYDETLARDAEGNYICDINGQKVPMRIDGTWTQKPGDVRYADINHDGMINEYDIVYLGNSFPTITGGGSLKVAYKSWSLRASVHFRLGQSIVNMVKHDMEKMNNGNNQSKTVLNRWRYEGDQTEIPRALWGTNYNTLGSSRFVEDGSFVKIKDITLDYALPEAMMRKIGITRAKVFITTYNIFTFTNYTGQDPEIGIENGAYGIAIDSNRTPPAQRVALGLSFNF